jgi:hypothetical protein
MPCLRGLRPAPALNDFVKDIAVLIHGPPQPVLLTGNGDYTLVEMPDVVAGWSLAPEAAGVVRAELQSPAPDSLIGDDDTTLEQHLLNQTKAQREPEIVGPEKCGSTRPVLGFRQPEKYPAARIN